MPENTAKPKGAETGSPAKQKTDVQADSKASTQPAHTDAKADSKTGTQPGHMDAQADTQTQPDVENVNMTDKEKVGAIS